MRKKTARLFLEGFVDSSLPFMCILNNLPTYAVSNFISHGPSKTITLFIYVSLKDFKTLTLSIYISLKLLISLFPSISFHNHIVYPSLSTALFVAFTVLISFSPFILRQLISPFLSAFLKICHFHLQLYCDFLANHFLHLYLSCAF